MRQGETDPDDTFKLRFDKIYETRELTGGNTILCREQLTKNRNQVSTKEKQALIDQMKAMCFLLSSDQKRYLFLLNQMRYGNNLVRYEYPATTTSALDIFIRIEGGICKN